MTDRRPEPGSPWARHCPDAWPREWLDATGELPAGFTRPATPLEADLITGRTSEAAFLAAPGRPLRNGATSRPRPGSTPPPERKRNPVVMKVLGYRRFFDALPTLDPRLSSGAVAVWCWLWTCERKGHARCSVRRLGRRFGVSKSTAGRWLCELIAAGFARIVRAGRPNRSHSVIRVRSNPTPLDDRTGRKNPQQKASTSPVRPTGGTG